MEMKNGPNSTNQKTMRNPSRNTIKRYRRQDPVMWDRSIKRGMLPRDIIEVIIATRNPNFMKFVEMGAILLKELYEQDPDDARMVISELKRIQE